MTETDARTVAAKKLIQLYTPLLELVAILHTIEPGGTLADVLTFSSEDGEWIRVEFTAMPPMLTVKNKRRKMILRVIELEG
jgi:hypothetical protein